MDSADSSARFRWVKAPTNSELNQLTHTITHHLARYLERQGLLEWNDRYAVLNGRSPAFGKGRVLADFGSTSANQMSYPAV